MTPLHYAGALAVLVVTAAVGMYSGSRVRSAADFSGGGGGAGMVAGAVIGSLVGGASTIGTAQLAYDFGLSAWWFTLGGGMGCLAMACFFVRPLFTNGSRTLPRIIGGEFGGRVGVLATILISSGNFLTVATQVLSGAALIAAICGVPAVPAALITVVLMLFYVVFGGNFGAGLVGMLKTVLLVVSVGTCAAMAVRLQGGLASFHRLLPAERYFDLFIRGINLDLSSGLSLVVGILTTQAYIQAALSARSFGLSRAGFLLAAFLVPAIGGCGIIVGMYMRLHSPNISAGAALPLFIMERMPAFSAGMVLAVLLVAVVGTGAGISLGISAMLVGDIYKPLVNPDAGDARLLAASRLAIGGVLALSFAVIVANMDAMILDISYLSMGLRGAVGFGPVCLALFAPGLVGGGAVIVSMLAAPILLLLGRALLPADIDPLFPTLLATSAILVAGALWRRWRRGAHQTS